MSFVFAYISRIAAATRNLYKNKERTFNGTLSLKLCLSELNITFYFVPREIYSSKFH